MTFFASRNAARPSIGAGPAGEPAFMAYARRGRNSPVRYGLTLVLGLALMMALGAVVLAVLELVTDLPADLAARMQDPRRFDWFFGSLGLTFLVALAGMLAACRLVLRKGLSDLLGDWRWSSWLSGAGVWIIVLSLAALSDYLIAPGGFRISAGPETLRLLAWAAPALLVQTFAEEVIFRGFVTQGLLLGVRSVLPAAVLSGIAFGAMHIPNGGPQAASATLLGIVLALVVIRTGSLAFASGLHFANNLFGAVVLVSAQDVFAGVPALVTQSTPHLMWWDTLVAALALAGLALFILRSPRFAPQPPGG